MGDETWQAFSQIIKAAAVSSLGLAALVVLVISFVGLKLFGPRDRPGVRVLVFLVLVSVSVSVFAAGVYGAQPTLPGRDETKAASLPSAVRPQPPAPAPPTAPPARPEGPRRPSPSAAMAARPHALIPETASASRADCGKATTAWIPTGGAVGNPCPAGCTQGAELTRVYRVVGFPPRPQGKYEFKCWRP